MSFEAAANNVSGRYLIAMYSNSASQFSVADVPLGKSQGDAGGSSIA